MTCLSPIRTEDVIRTLRDNPAGLTTGQMAERMGQPFNRMSQRLCKLAMYGRIDRDFIHSGVIGRRGHASRWSIWRLKTETRVDKAMQEQIDADH